MGRVRILHLTKKDFIRQTFRAGGKGGQKQNKTETGVRFIHEPSGARGESREHSKQLQNERAAFRRMAESPQMQIWIQKQHQAWERCTWIPEPSDTDILCEVRDEHGNWVRAS